MGCSSCRKKGDRKKSTAKSNSTYKKTVITIKKGK